MLNLLGDLWFARRRREPRPDWAAVLALPGAHLHLYGKAERAPRPQDGPPDRHRARASPRPRRAPRDAARLLGIAGPG